MASNTSSHSLARFASISVPTFDFQILENDGLLDGKCSLSGELGNMTLDLFIKPWLKLGHNCTMKMHDNYGSIDGKSGIRGSMAMKETDVALIVTKIWETQLDYIEYSIPIFDEFLQIICSYNYTERFEDQDLIDSYTEFHWSYYLSLITTLIAFICIWEWCSLIASKFCEKVKKEISKSRYPSYWIMTCAILDQNQFPMISRIAFTILSFCFSLFFFIMIDCFMLNVMRAELVTIEEPRVIRSYDDIIKREDLQILFFQGGGEEEFFRKAPLRTKEYEIWQKRIVMHDFSSKSIGEVWQPIIDQRIVTVVRDWIGRSAANLGLSKTREIGIDYIRAIETKDEAGKFFSNAFMIQKEAPQVLKNYMKERIYRIANSGIIQWYIKERIPHLFGDGSEIFLDQFVSSNLFLPSPPDPEIKLSNVHKFFKVYFSLFIIALIVLIYEIIGEKLVKKLIESKEQIRIIRRERLRQKRMMRMKIRKGIRGRIRDWYDRLMNPISVV